MAESAPALRSAGEPDSAVPAAVSETRHDEVFDNDVVAVWDVAWLKQKYPLHTHRYDLVGMSYAEGDRIITQGDGPGRLVQPRPGCSRRTSPTITHVEEGASDPPMRAVQIELKNAAPRGAAGDGPDGLRQVAGAPAWENSRAAAWLVTGGTPAPKHRHVGDAVEMVFDASTPPKPEGDVRAGRNRSRWPDAGRRRPGVYLRNQVGRIYDPRTSNGRRAFLATCATGRRGRRPAAGRVRAGG